MASSSKRKEDDKNLKLLRELASQRANKLCFDCEQKGPTYINMTIGSFVCTSCSGILRGLTPPHRVKSITMASFTTEEIDQLRHRGNHYCKAVWLGLLKDAPLQGLGSKSPDENRLRDILIDKYERKRYYIDPIVVAKNMSQEQAAATSTAGATTSPTPPQQPITPPQSTAISRNASTEAAALLKNLSPLVTPAQDAVPSFANFDTANIFTQTNTPPTAGQSIQTSASVGKGSQHIKAGAALLQPLNPLAGTKASGAGGATGTGATAEDRYAALKSLDEEFKIQLQPVEAGVAAGGANYPVPPAPVVSGASSPPNYFAAFGGTGGSGGNGNVFGAANANGAHGGAGLFGDAVAIPNGAAGLFGGAFDGHGASGGGPFGATAATSPFGSVAAPSGPFGSPPTFGGLAAPNGVTGASSAFGVFGTSPVGAAGAAFGTSPGAAWGSFGAMPAAAPNPFAGYNAALPPTSSNYNPFTAGVTESAFNSNNNGSVNKNGNDLTGGTVDSTNNWANFSAFDTASNGDNGSIKTPNANNNKNSDNNMKNIIGNNTASATNYSQSSNNNWANFSMNNFSSTTSTPPSDPSSLTTGTAVSLFTTPSTTTNNSSNNNWANFGDNFNTNCNSLATAGPADPWANASSTVPAQQASSLGLFGSSAAGPAHTAVSPSSFNPFL